VKKLLILVVVFFTVIQAGFAQQDYVGMKTMVGVYQRQDVLIATFFYNNEANMHRRFDLLIDGADNDFLWERLPENQSLGGIHLVDFALGAVNFSREASSGFRITEQEGQTNNSPHFLHMVHVFLPSSTIVILVREGTQQPGYYRFLAWVRRD